MQESHENLEQEQEELQLTIKRLLHQLYGRRSERWKDSPGQQQLDFGAEEPSEPEGPSASASEDEGIVREHVLRRNERRRSEKLPDHLQRRSERIGQTLAGGVKLADCELIGVDVVEILGFDHPSLWVRRIEYPKYKLPKSSLESPSTSPIVQASRALNLIEGGRFGFGVVTEVLSSKFNLHVPLYRQQDTFAQLGWSASRSTLSQIVATAAEVLVPLAELFRQRVLAVPVLGTDDTPVRLLTPGEGEGSREARLWLYRGRDAAQYNVFAFTDNRTRAGPDQFLESFCGTLSGDCYSGYVNIEEVTMGRIRFSACLAHARRKVFESREQQPLLSSQILALIGELYDIEDRARGLDDGNRLAMRQLQSVPVMARLRALLDSEAAARVLPASSFGKSLAYLRNHWSAFGVYLQDGRVPIDNNDVERDLRRVAIGRKNWLFLGSRDAGRRTATILSVIGSAYRHDLDVWAYVRDVLEQLAGGSTELESLLPDVWKAAHPEHVRTFREQEKEARAATRRFQRARRRLKKRAPAQATR
jgi:transposase